MWARMSTSPQHVFTRLLCVRKQQPRRCFNLRSCFSHAALNAEIIPTPSWVPSNNKKFPRRKYSPLPPTNIYTDFILPHTFFLEMWFDSFLLRQFPSPPFFDPSPTGIIGFPHLQLEGDPDTRDVMWNHEGQEAISRRIAAIFRKSSPFTLTPVVLCPLIQAGR